ncbi:MAG: radical SAM protein [Clostridiales bacterium]|nr:radical SAM protein [Clostridiales bacterium]
MKLKKAYIEITNICNLHCSFCHGSNREKQNMKVDQFWHIAKKIRPYVDSIYLHVLGEPLCHPQLKEILDIANELSFKVNITTNGTLIRKKTPVLLQSECLRQVNFSVHCIEECGLKKEEYLQGICQFIHQAAKKGIYSCIRLWNIDEDECTDKNQQLFQWLQNEFGADKVAIKTLTKGNGITLSKNIFLQQSRRFIWPDLNEKEIFLKGSCPALRDHFGVLSNGDMICCCLDAEGDLVLGNLLEQEFLDIYQSQRAVQLRENFRRQVVSEKLCRTCGWNRKNVK